MRILFIFLCSLLLVGNSIAAATSPARPNILIILADDLGYGDLSCYGATKVSTPNIDRLAQEGMRFTDAHSPHSVCTPTRYSLMTGCYAWRNWGGNRCVWANDPLLIDTKRLTLPKLLQNHGYYTACIGKWHLGFGSPSSPGWDPVKGPDYNQPLVPGPLEVGFNYFFGIPHVGQQPHVFIENHHVVGLSKESPLQIVLDERQRNRKSYLDRQNITPAHKFLGGQGAIYDESDLALDLTDKAVNWLKNYQKDKPFFLYLAHRNVHAPLRPNQRFQKTSAIGVYGDFINELDWSVGEVLRTLDELGLAKNTLVLFSSDNGGVQLGHKPAKIVDYSGHKANGPFRGQKTEVYEGGNREPLLVRWPGVVKPGSTNDHLVALTDVMATFADYFGDKLPPDAAEDSFSFLPLLTHALPKGPVRKNLVMDSNQGCYSIRQGDWKLLLCQGGGGIGWNAEDNDKTQPPGQLYNLKKDLGEQSNLYTTHPEKVAELTRLLEQLKHTGSRLLK